MNVTNGSWHNEGFRNNLHSLGEEELSALLPSRIRDNSSDYFTSGQGRVSWQNDYT